MTQLKRPVLAVWALLIVVFWFLSGQSWFSISTDSAQYLVTGQVAFPFVAGYLWLNLLAVLAVFVLRKIASIVAAVVTAAASGISAAAVLNSTLGAPPNSVYEFVATQTGITDDFPVVALGWSTAGFGSLAFLCIVQIAAILAIIKAPQKVRRYETDVKRDGDDPISLWDSQS